MRGSGPLALSKYCVLPGLCTEEWRALQPVFLYVTAEISYPNYCEKYLLPVLLTKCLLNLLWRLCPQSLVMNMIPILSSSLAQLQAIILVHMFCNQIWKADYYTIVQKGLEHLKIFVLGG